MLSAIRTNCIMYFYPRSPCGERRYWPCVPVVGRTISIHALLAESDEAAEVVARVIAKNKEHRTITADTVMEWMDMDQLAGFVLDFVSWLSNEKKNDPN